MSETRYHSVEESKSYELYERDALGNILTELFPGYGELLGVPENCDPCNYELLSVFVKEGRNKFVCVGNLRTDGGIIQDNTLDIRKALLPHFHCSSKEYFDRYLTAVKYPFSSRILEFTAKKLVGRPEGKHFAWLDLGTTQVTYVDPAKLTAKLMDDVCRVNSQDVLQGKDCFYVIHKVCSSERLNYSSSWRYQSTSWLGKDPAAIEQQIKNATKTSPCVVNSSRDAPRAFCFCRVPISKDGTLAPPNYNVKLLPTNPVQRSRHPDACYAEELDFDFTSWLVSHFRGMKTRELWQPAIKDLYTLLDAKARHHALEFLLSVIRKFQTDEEQVVQMVDLSFAIANIPDCLTQHPMILSRVLRGAGIVLTNPSPNDSDDEIAEPQIVFQPANSQDYLKTLEFLLNILYKGVITDSQGEAAADLLSLEVVSLQELFYTQMGCVCEPWKSLNPREEPMGSLWKKGTRTRRYLESLGLKECSDHDQKIVVCPRNLHLINVLSVFFSDID